jgi:hypothetical protein
LRAILIALALISGQAAAQPSAAPKPPQAPTKPVAPKSAAPQSRPAQPTDDDEIKLSADVAALLSRPPTVITQAIRARAASALSDKPVPLNAIVSAELRTVTPRNPVANGAALAMRAGYWATSATGPSILYLPSRQTTPAAAITLRFSASASMRYLVLCHLSNPANWDIIIDGRITPLNAHDDVTGAALIPAVPTQGQRTAKLVVARASEASASRTEFLQRCELTPIRD